MSDATVGQALSTKSRDAYVALGFVSVAHAVTHVYSAVMPLVYPFMLSEFGFGYGHLGLMLTAGSVAGGGLQLVFGFLSRYVARNVLLGLGNALIGLSTLGAASAATFAQFFFWSIVARVGNAPQHPVGNAMIAERFARTRRGLAMAVHFAGGNAGTVLVPVAAALLIHSFGWRSALVLFALPGLIVGALLVLLLRDGKGALGEERGLRHFGGQVLATLRQRQVLLILVATVVAAGGRGMGIVGVFVPAYLQDPEKGLGMELIVVGSLMTLLMVGSVVGPLVAGRLSDLWSRRSTLLAAYLVATVGTVLFSSRAAGDWLLPVSLAIMGLSVYAQSPLLQTYVADLTSSTARDAVFGVYFTVSFLAGAFWVSAIGYLVQVAGFGAAFALMAASYVAAAACIVLVSDRAPTDAAP